MDGHIVFDIQSAHIFTACEKRASFLECSFRDIVAVHLQDSVASLQEAISNGEERRREREGVTETGEVGGGDREAGRRERGGQRREDREEWRRQRRAEKTEGEQKK